MKPREQWDREDYLDFLDGWHEQSDVHFTSERDRTRKVRYEVVPDTAQGMLDDLLSSMAEPIKPTYSTHASAQLFDLGRDHRIAHRQATGI